jgi:sulfonate transport system ATP-binding protein
VSGHASQQAVVRVRGLTRRFGERVVLDELDLTIPRGEFVALLGRSGSGKSTLLRALADLDTGVTGELAVDGTFSVAFQEHRLLLWRRVRENVALGLPKQHSGSLTVDEALAEVGLDGHANVWPLTLSGGEAQRASLARALVREPDLLLLDEPFGALDALTRLTMQRLVERLWTRHRPAVLFVTHDVDEALLLADRVLVLTDGRIGYQAVPDAERPRDREDPSLAAIRHALLAELGVPRYEIPDVRTAVTQ